MNQKSVIDLSISEAEDHPKSIFQFHIMQDGKVITSNRSLSQDESEALREISRNYSLLFEEQLIPKMSATDQLNLGKKLFDLFLASYWDRIQVDLLGNHRLIVIASDVPDILNLPWELLSLPDGEFVGTNPLFSIRRLPIAGKQLTQFNGELRPPPLRLLFIACAPTGLEPLDYELEEEILLEAVSGLYNVSFDSCDMGTFEELQERVNEYQPHVVHMIGHGIVEDGQGKFAFEDETGRPSLQASGAIRQRLAGRGIQCIFVSGCQTGKTPSIDALEGICQGLVSQEIPMAIGWAASIDDRLARLFTRTFYKTLASRQSVDLALVQGRQVLWDNCKKTEDLSWSLPVLYAVSTQGLIFDPDPNRLVVEPPRPSVVQKALPGMIEGHAEYFVGRRREQQRILHYLREDGQVIIITGLGGSGKSSLATRLARKLEAEGFTLIAVPSSIDLPLNAQQLLDKCSNAFLMAASNHRSIGEEIMARKLDAAYNILNNPNIPVRTRLQYIITTLNYDLFLMVLDNFESNIDWKDRHVLNPEVAEFYKYLLTNLSGRSRVIITSRYLPGDLIDLPSKVKVEAIGDIGESAFLKILKRDDVLNQRHRSGILSLELLHTIYENFGGTPRLLLQMRKAIRDIEGEELKFELSKIELPHDAKPSELQKIRDQYFKDIFTSRLYGYLSPESQTSLSKAAVYEIAISFDGLAAVTGMAHDKLSNLVREWQDRAFVYSDSDRSTTELWTVYKLLRCWLLVQLSPTDKKSAHMAAGDFLYKLYRDDNEISLGLSWLDCLQEARAQYLQAEDFARARSLTDRISGYFIRRGLYDGVRRLDLEILEYEKYNRNSG